MSQERPPTPNPSREEISEWTANLPPTQDGFQISDTVAQATFFVLENSSDGSKIPENIRAGMERTYKKVTGELEPAPATSAEAYIITGDQLRGLIAKAAMLGGAQAVLQIGKGLSFRAKEIAKLNELFGLSPSGEHGGGEAVPPAAEPPAGP